GFVVLGRLRQGHGTQKDENEGCNFHGHDKPLYLEIYIACRDCWRIENHTFSSTTVAPAPPSFWGGSLTVSTCGCFCKNCRKAFLRIPIPIPCTMRTLGIPARKARSTNFSTSRVASSTLKPITLSSVGALRSSWMETEMPLARAAATGELPLRLTTSATSCRGIFIFMAP